MAVKYCSKYNLLFFVLFLIVILQDSCDGEKRKSEPTKKKEKSSKIGKNVMDYSEADMHKLLDQWDENDEDIDEDDRYDDFDPRKPASPAGPAFDPTQFKDDPIALMKLAKKGKVLMMFATVAGSPSKKDTEQITARWQTSLFNAQIQVERYLVSDDRALLMLKDGSLAWDVKDYLITQPDCLLVEFDNQQFPGAGDKSKSSKTEL